MSTGLRDKRGGTKGELNGEHTGRVYGNGSRSKPKEMRGETIAFGVCGGGRTWGEKEKILPDAENAQKEDWRGKNPRKAKKRRGGEGKRRKRKCISSQKLSKAIRRRMEGGGRALQRGGARGGRASKRDREEAANLTTQSKRSCGGRKAKATHSPNKMK